MNVAAVAWALTGLGMRPARPRTNVPILRRLVPLLMTRLRPLLALLLVPLALSGPASAIDMASPGGPGPSGGTCAVWEINVPGSVPLTETVFLDPDGCIRGVVRRVLGWPPTLP